MKMNNFANFCDKFLFKLIGIAIGIVGVTFIIKNNDLEILLHNLYGFIFLALFATIGIVSAITLIIVLAKYKKNRLSI